MEKQNLDKGKIKKKVNDQEIEYVNIAENFFEAALQEKDLNKSNIAFGKGLACFVCIYDSRSWWSKHSPFKSIFTGVRPLAKAINKFKNVDSKQTEKASKALNEMLDTLYLTVFRNHSIKAFKSKLETSKLKELLSKINKETIKTVVKDYITNIQKGISDGLKGLKPMFGKDNTCNLQKINVECGKPNLDKGEIKEKVNDQEIEYVNIAENFFEATLKEKNIERSAIAFGKGLACFVCIYDNQSWWSKHSPFKSIFTGVRPLAKAINKFKNVDSKQTKKASRTFNKMLDTLYLTVFRNHSIEAFKSKLETSKLKAILLGIKTQKGDYEKTVKDKLEKIEKNIENGIWRPDEGVENMYTASGFGVVVGGTVLGGGVHNLFVAGVGAVIIALAGAIAAFAGICHLLGSVGKIITGKETEIKSKYLEEYKENFSKQVGQSVQHIKKGILDGLKGLKPLMNKENTDSLQKIKAKFVKT